MWPRSRLCALHFSNHLVVQELLLHASLGRNSFSLDDGKAYLALAKHIAQLAFFCAQTIDKKHTRRGSAKTPWSHNAARHVVVERIRQQSAQQAVERHHVLTERKIPVFYDDAVRHQQRLQQLLGPHGYRVALTGIMRRGCPLAQRATFLLTRDDQGDWRGGDGTGGKNNKDENEHDNGDSGLQILFERALSGLVASGYVKQFAKGGMRGTGRIVRRYVCLSRVPGQCGPEPLLFRGEAVQELVFLLSPAHNFSVSCLFFTGPSTFLSHLMLLAHAKGFELLHDGLYRLLRDKRELVVVNREEDIFTMLGIPYVHPFCRYAYCRLNNLL